MDIWKAAGFGEFIKSGRTVARKITDLHSKYVKLGRMETLNWSSSKSNHKKLQDDFISESNTLLDISVIGIEDKIKNDRLLSEEATGFFVCHALF